VLDWQQRLIARNGKCSFNAICKDIIEAIAEAGIERPVLCGHSLGGFLATQIAYEHGLSIRGLLILDSALPLPLKMRSLWQDAARKLEAGPWDEVFPGIESPFFTDSEEGEIKESIMRSMSAQPPRVAIGLLDEICSYEWKSQLVEIDVPVHLVASEHGWLDMDAFHELVPGATSERIDGSGHFITVFHGDQVNQIMHAFLQRLPE
jgi:pimeloyl-ACP methyl ester carboxylesterase